MKVDGIKTKNTTQHRETGSGDIETGKALRYLKACRDLIGKGYTVRYNKADVMKWAWIQYRADGELSFSECLHRSWLSAKAAPVNAERIRQAAAAAGITERYNTYSRWQMMGFEVIHGSKAAFGAELIWGSRGDGATYKARFFTASQVQFIA